MLLVVWVRFELRVPEPLVDIELMRLRGVWTTNLTALLVGFGMFGSFILIPQFVAGAGAAGFGFGATVTEAGLFMLPSAAVMLVAGPIAGSLASRFGSRLPLLIGTLLRAAAFGLLAVAHDPSWHIYLASALMGIGIGFAFAAMANLIVEAVDADQTGVATGMNTIMRTIGGALGGQISATIVAAPPGGHGPAGRVGLHRGVRLGSDLGGRGLRGRATLIPGRHARAATTAELEPRSGQFGEPAQVAEKTAAS